MQAITLTTDFGTIDPYAGVMKGVILSLNPYAKIIDITHNISPQNIWQANWTLRSSYKFFPKNTIHICVVDPGVGTKRKAIIIETSDYYFIGPNNGVFTWLIRENQIKHVIEIKEKKYFLPEVSHTFHGRDIFAPVAAHLAKGTKLEQFGPEVRISELVKNEDLEVKKYKHSCRGVIQHIDRFGNLITNIPNNILPLKIYGKLNRYKFKGFYFSYTDGRKEELFAIKASHGFVELSVNHSNAQKLTKANIGDEIEINF